MNPSECPIGIFDSGVGGLTVYQQLKKQLSHERFVYLGDTARVPYGTKSKETVMRYSMQNCLFLMDHGVKLIVVACNTASAFALTYLQERIKTHVLGVIEPGAQAAVQATRNQRIGIIGTEGTIRSGMYEQAIKKLLPDAVITSQATGLFVPLVEEGITQSNILTAVLDYYLAPLKQKKIDTLILGCTHYPLLKDSFQKYLDQDVTIVDSAQATARVVQDVLKTNGLENKAYGKRSDDLICTTDAPEHVERVAQSFLFPTKVSVVKVCLGS